MLNCRSNNVGISFHPKETDRFIIILAILQLFNRLALLETQQIRLHHNNRKKHQNNIETHQQKKICDLIFLLEGGKF